MKLLLLICCLSGTALATSWQPHEPEFSSRDSSRIKLIEIFLNQSITDLTLQMDHLTTEAKEYFDRGLIYFQKPAGELIDKMIRQRTEMLQFQVNLAMSNQAIDLEKVYGQLYDKNSELARELLQLYTENRREHSKHLALSVAAYQNIAYNSSLPDANRLTSEVKHIIRLEETIRKQENDLAKEKLSDWYRELDRSLVDATITENSKQFYNSIKSARTTVALLEEIGETKQAETLANGLDLAEFSAYEMFKLVPIKSNEKIVEVMKLARIAYRAGKNLKALLESHSSVVASAETSQSDWITNSTSYLTSEINELSKEASKYQQMNATYMPGLLSHQVSKMEHLRSEMKTFLAKLTNSSIVSPLELKDDQSLKRFKNDFELVKQDTRDVMEQVQRDWKKWAILFIAASQNVAYDRKLPGAQRLIGDVKSIISKEEAIKNQEKSSNDTNGMMKLVETEVNDWYEQFNKDFLKIIERRKNRLFAAKRDALKMREGRDINAAEDADRFSVSLNKISSYYRMFQHFPIDSSKAAEQVVATVGELIHSGRNMETLNIIYRKKVFNEYKQSVRYEFYDDDD